MHPGTRRNELTDRMVHVLATRLMDQTYDLLACLQTHQIENYEWYASVVEHDAMRDPICLLELVIPDQKKAVYFKMFFEHSMPMKL